MGQLLQRYEKLQEVVDSLMSRRAVGKVLRQLPRQSQVGRWRHGGLGRGLPGLPWLVVLCCNMGEPLAAPHIGLYTSAARKEMKALVQMSCWHREPLASGQVTWLCPHGAASPPLHSTALSSSSLQQDEEVPKRVQATLVQVQGSYEKLSSVVGNLLRDSQRQQQDTKVGG